MLNSLFGGSFGDQALLFCVKEMLKREGNSLVFTTSEGEVIKKFRKAWEKNDDGCLDKVMADFGNQKAEVSTPEETADE